MLKNNGFHNRHSPILRAFSPLSLFSGGAPGAWYDPSDYGATGTLFQDSAGTTPVTAVEQPVGLMLDKSQGLVFGPELVTNGDFSNGTTGWSTNVTTIFTVSGGVATVQNLGADGLIGQTKTGLVVGQSYLITATISNVTGGANPDLRIGTSLGNFNFALKNTGTGNFRYVFVATTTSAAFSFSTGSAAVSGPAFSIDNVSIQFLAGNHAFQATSASRPVLSARKNWLLATETLSTQNVTVLAGQMVLSFYGTGTVTLSGTSTAGPLVGTGVANRVSLTFTPTAGTLTLTVSGSVTQAQLEYVA